MKPETENWLKIARSDLKVAELCFKNDCHSKTIEQCHSCLEKLLKGIKEVFKWLQKQII